MSLGRFRSLWRDPIRHVVRRRPRVPGGRIGEPVREGHARVLLYHSVLNTPTDPWWIRVRPERFMQHMEVLRRHMHPMSLADLHRAAEANAIPRGAVAVTFDDGYVDNLQHALPALKRYEIPATIFVTSSYIDSPYQYWWDELESILIHTPRLPGSLRLTIGSKERTWTFDTAEYVPTRADRRWRAWDTEFPTPRHMAYRQLWGDLREVETPAREAVMDHLRKWAGRTEPYLGPCRPMTQAELQLLVGEPLVEIAAHTRTHPSLGFISPESQWDEIGGSKAALETMIRKPVASLAYPYGADEDYSPTTRTIAREAGFARATTNHGGSVRPGCEATAIPRVIVQDWDRPEFCVRLSTWYRA